MCNGCSGCIFDEVDEQQETHKSSKRKLKFPLTAFVHRVILPRNIVFSEITPKASKFTRQFF